MDCRRLGYHLSGIAAVFSWGLTGTGCKAERDMRASPEPSAATVADAPAGGRAGAESTPAPPHPETPLADVDGAAPKPLAANGAGAGMAGLGASGKATLDAGEDEDEIPRFPWPPPRASTQVVLPREALVAAEDATPTLRGAEVRLRRGLDEAGYVETSYYAVPGGFALVTRLEQIEEDGRPKPVPERWMVDLRPLRKFSLGVYLKSLFTAQPGYYRILVFVLTDRPFSTSPDVVTRDDANEWLTAGANRLPTALGERVFSLGHACTVLVYEFEQPDRGQEALIRTPGRLAARTHLVRANLWGKLVP